jgi:hypothetical protein
MGSSPVAYNCNCSGNGDSSANKPANRLRPAAFQYVANGFADGWLFGVQGKFALK